MEREVVIRNKKQFKEAVEKNTERFVVEGKFAKDLKKVLVIKTISKSKIKVIAPLIAIAGGSSAVAACGIALTPVTGGASTVVSGGAGLTAASAAAAIAAVTSKDVAIIVLAVSIGFMIVWTATQNYDIHFETSTGRIVFDRKKGK